MRYYIINSEGKEIAFDIAGVKKNKAGVLDFDITTQANKHVKYYVKSLAGKNYISKDQVNWSKAPQISDIKKLVNVTETLNVYRGFKPSGLSQANAGTLITDMPGKVVKVLTTEGAAVNQGDTLLILEAMKMENEIKAGVDGIVKTVNVSEGQAIESGTLMIEIEE
jgi:biotin carboxyl carrier protein